MRLDSQPLPPPSAGPIASGPRLREPLRFLFTIDTEVSLGGALEDRSLRPVGAGSRIWGQTRHGRSGIDTFMDIFDEFGMKGVFFVEVCGRHLVQEKTLAHVARHIRARGHDVELHVHPEFIVNLARSRKLSLPKPSAYLCDYEPHVQKSLLFDAFETLKTWTGHAPVAFRAGSFGSNETIFPLLAQLGIKIDSTYNLWAQSTGVGRFQTHLTNDAQPVHHGLFEVPVTCYLARGMRGGLRQFDLASMTTQESIEILETLYATGARTCCAISHSFRLIQTTDRQYTDARPDRINIDRVRRLCRYLHDHRSRFKVCTYRQLPLSRWHEDSEPLTPPVPMARPLTSMRRLALQIAKDWGTL